MSLGYWTMVLSLQLHDIAPPPTLCSPSPTNNKAVDSPLPIVISSPGQLKEGTGFDRIDHQVHDGNQHLVSASVLGVPRFGHGG